MSTCVRWVGWETGVMWLGPSERVLSEEAAVAGLSGEAAGVSAQSSGTRFCHRHSRAILCSEIRHFSSFQF